MAAALTCGEAFKKLSTFCSVEDRQKTFLNFLLDRKSIVNFRRFSLVAVQQKKKYQNLLLYDGRFGEDKDRQTVVCFLLDAKGVLLLETFDSVEKLPKLGRENFRKPRHPQESLAALLDLNVDSEADPKNWQETFEFLSSNVGAIDSVNVYYSNRPKFMNEGCMWNVAESAAQKNIEAFTSADYSLRFRPKIMPKYKKQNYFTFQQTTPAAEATAAEDWCEKNRSSAVSVSLSGLNEAYNLGCVPLDNLDTLSHSLGRLVGSLDLQYDDASMPRLATFYSFNSLKQFELPQKWDEVMIIKWK
jgi:hypothetical protein